MANRPIPCPWHTVVWLASTLCSCSVDDRVVSLGSLPSSNPDSLTGGDAQDRTPSDSQDAGASRPEFPGDNSEAAEAAEIVQPAATTQPVDGPAPLETTPCQAQQRRCAVNSVQVCLEGVWQEVQECSAPFGFCLPSIATCAACEPGTESCNGITAQLCNASGQWQSLNSCTGQQVNCGQCELAPSDCPDIDSVLAGEEPLVVGDQALVISRVRFDPSGIGEVTLQNRGSSFVSFAADTFALCSGSESCEPLSAARPVQLNFGTELAMEVPNLAPTGGQLAVLARIEAEGQQFLLVENYIAWGTTPIDDDFEQLLLNEAPVWQLGARIEVDPSDTGFVCIGPSDEAGSYRSCNP